MDTDSQKALIERELLINKFQKKIKVLSETAWRDRELHLDEVENWLDQFGDSEEERLHFLHLLSCFMYFGVREVREMLKSLYRDIYKVPTILRIRKEQGETKDACLLNKLFEAELKQTRFLGIGNPSESGTHLLYMFRQINSLPNKLFINGRQTYRRKSDGSVEIEDPKIQRYVFLDDLTGTGSQAEKYSKKLISTIKALAPNARVDYYVLFATVEAIETIRNKTLFDDVRAVFIIDETFKCFHDASRYFRDSESLGCIEREKSMQLCRKYDQDISQQICEKEGFPGESYYELGFNESQLLLSFHHNTPDNAPPIFWYESLPSDSIHWKPIFNRFHKVY